MTSEASTLAGLRRASPVRVLDALEARRQGSTMMAGWRPYVLLAVLFAATRAVLYAAGIRFDFALDWMWLADPADLRGRLMETVYYYHAFPPGMNLLTGLLLKAGGEYAGALAQATFWALGLVLVHALFYLCTAAGLRRAWSFGLALAFSLLPQTIYFESLYLYEYPVAALLLVSAVLFHRGIAGPSSGFLFFFFLACCAIGLTRSTFHLVWFAASVGLALLCVRRGARGGVLRAALVPAVLLVALYAKNLTLFGTFDAFTFGPVSQSLVTVWQLPPDVRDAWIARGTLSPFAAVNVYAGPREYLPLVRAQAPEWPPLLTSLERPTVGAPNYNHWLFLEVNRARRTDSLRYVRERPWEYAATAAEGLRDFFTATTTWHPLDASGGSPHAENRDVLGSYESGFNRLVHGFPVPPIGTYVFLPVVLVWAGLRARRLVRAADPRMRAGGALFLFCLFQIAFVTAASSLFTSRESARYRFQVEALIWVSAAACLAGSKPWRGGAQQR